LSKKIKKVDELSTKIRVIYLQQKRTQKFWFPLYISEDPNVA